jgi:hypothetical protein
METRVTALCVFFPSAGNPCKKRNTTGVEVRWEIYTLFAIFYVEESKKKEVDLATLGE